MNHNFHAHEGDACQRLLNAIEPGSYVQPHRHLAPGQDESCVVLRGRLGILLFDERGQVTQKAVAEPGGELFGLTIPAGTFHTLIALAPGSVFFEAKAGPYRPLSDAERAAFAPREGEPAAERRLAELAALFRG